MDHIYAIFYKVNWNQSLTLNLFIYYFVFLILAAHACINNPSLQIYSFKSQFDSFYQAINK